MPGIQVTIRRNTIVQGSKRAFDGLQDASDEGLLEEGKFIRRRWRRNMRKRTRRLWRSIRIVLTGSGQRRGVRVFSDEPHAEIEERGSRRHIILPKSLGGVLRFKSGGKVIFARRVVHPGTKGSNALKRATSVYRSGRAPLLRRQLEAAVRTNRG